MSLRKNSRSSYQGPRGRRGQTPEKVTFSNHSSRNLRFDHDGPKNRPVRGMWVPIAIAGVVVALLGVSAVLSFSRSSSKTESSAEAIANETSETPAASLTVNGISLKGLSTEAAISQISDSLSWKITAVYGDDEKELPNLLTSAISTWLTEKEQENTSGELTLTAADLPLEPLKEAVTEEAKALADHWDVPAKISTLDRFDTQKGQFVFREGCAGVRIDQNQLTADLLSAISNDQLDASLEVQSYKEAPAISCDDIKASYKTIATFTTETTDNNKRNTNVRLAAEALNGTIVQPGEEFSFNSVVGQRTAEKGYQEAAAYNSGAVVQEIGGGVCQISSTLYRVVFQSGMEVTFRRSHTFEPNYVTPGQDAAISWEQPDFRFVNTSDNPIGIRASYENRKATVSLFGIPVLEDGVTWDLASEKVEEIDPPEPEYVEDPTLAPGTEKTVKAATNGSRWDTYKVVYKNGEEVERTLDHSKTYLGHSAVIHRNSSGTGTTTKPAQESTSAGNSNSGNSVGNTTETSAASKQENTAKESKPAKAPTEAASSETTQQATAPAETSPAPEQPAPTEQAPAVDGMPEGYTPETIAPLNQ